MPEHNEQPFAHKVENLVRPYLKREPGSSFSFTSHGWHYMAESLHNFPDIHVDPNRAITRIISRMSGFGAGSRTVIVAAVISRGESFFDGQGADAEFVKKYFSLSDDTDKRFALDTAITLDIAEIMAITNAHESRLVFYGHDYDPFRNNTYEDYNKLFAQLRKTQRKLRARVAPTPPAMLR